MTLSVPASTVPGLLAAQASVRPRAIAVREKRLGIWREHTYSDLAGEVEALAASFTGIGVVAGDCVAIAAGSCRAALVADLAAQALGALSAVLYPSWRAQDMRAALFAARPKLVLCGDDDQAAQLAEEGDLPGSIETLVVLQHRGVGRDVPATDSALSASEAGETKPAIALVSYRDLLRSGREAAASKRIELSKLLSLRYPDEPAIVHFSAGTTGSPRGSIVTQRAQLAATAALVDATGLRSSDRELCHFSFAQPTARSLGAYGALLAGSSLSFPESADTVREDLVELAPSVLLGPPRLFELLRAEIDLRTRRASRPKRRVVGAGIGVLRGGRSEAESVAARRSIRPDVLLARALVAHYLRDRVGLASVRIAVCFGGHLDPDTARWFAAVGMPIRSVYGQAETCGAVSMASSSPGGSALEGPLGDIESRVDPEGRLEVKAPALLLGYLTDGATGPGLREVVGHNDGWFATGDRVSMGPAGRLELLDRAEDVTECSDGVQVVPARLEAALRASPYISNAVVTAIGDDVIASLQPERDNVGEWATHHGLGFTTYSTLVAHVEVQDLLKAEARRILSALAVAPHVAKIEILDRELDIESGHLTPLRLPTRRARSAVSAGAVEPATSGSAS